MLTINIRHADEHVETVPFESGELLVGRAQDCGVRLPDRDVSRQHLRLSRRDDGVYLEDLGSSFGTLLDERPVAPGAPTRLRPGDLVRVGHYVLQVEGIEEIVGSGLDDTGELIVEFDSEVDVGVERADTDPVGVSAPSSRNAVARPISESLAEAPPLPVEADEDEWGDDETLPQRRGGVVRAVLALVLVLGIVAGLIWYISTQFFAPETLEPVRPPFIEQPHEGDAAPGAEPPGP